MDMIKKTKSQAKPWLLSRRRPAIPAFLDPIRRLFEPPQRLIGSYVKKGQVVVDLGCGSGYYALPLAETVGSEGKVYAVDLGKNSIRTVEKKAKKHGYNNIEVYSSSAADLSFIKDRSVDFIFANGLL